MVESWKIVFRQKTDSEIWILKASVNLFMILASHFTSLDLMVECLFYNKNCKIL